MPKEISTLIFRAISNKIKEIKKSEPKKPKAKKVKQEGGDTLVLAAALCAAILMLSSVFFLVF
ncbi:MAG: hypothetical protein NE330_02040 [Lentisphaeraceae bacterium]|nr:hypothetical protein [Lentisphaeraceae bacterium]